MSDVKDAMRGFWNRYKALEQEYEKEIDKLLGNSIPLFQENTPTKEDDTKMVSLKKSGDTKMVSGGQNGDTKMVSPAKKGDIKMVSDNKMISDTKMVSDNKMVSPENKSDTNLVSRKNESDTKLVSHKKRSDTNLVSPDNNLVSDLSDYKLGIKEISAIWQRINDSDLSFQSKYILLSLVLVKGEPRFTVSTREIAKLFKIQQPHVVRAFRDIERIDCIKITKTPLGTVLDYSNCLELETSATADTNLVSPPPYSRYVVSSYSTSTVQQHTTNNDTKMVSPDTKLVSLKSVQDAETFALLLTYFGVNIKQLSRATILAAVGLFLEDVAMFARALYYAKQKAKNMDSYLRTVIRNRYGETLTLEQIRVVDEKLRCIKDLQNFIHSDYVDWTVAVGKEKVIQIFGLKEQTESDLLKKVSEIHREYKNGIVRIIEVLEELKLLELNSFEKKYLFQHCP